MDMKKIMHDTLILFVICIISGLLLGAAYEITAPITAERKAQEKAQGYKEVFVDGVDFEYEDAIVADVENSEAILEAAGLKGARVTDCMTVKDASGTVLGYAMSVASNGKEGEMITAVCYGVDGVVRGIKILESSETPGLGSLAEEPEFTDQFKDKTVESFEVVKGGAGEDGQVECLNGATLTSNAVVLAANAGIAFAQHCMSK